MQLRRATIAKGLAAVFVFNLVVMAGGAWLASQSAPPIPEQVVGPDGGTVVTDDQIRDGKKTFQQDGLMNHGSILGNGAYYGADYTAETLELIPLVFILYEALGQYRAMSAGGESFPYRLPFMFIIASGIWNFVGAGVLGFFINLPLLNYYEHGTYLTVGHAHAAMFGAFGFLALGMVTYMLRIAIDPARWDGTWLRYAFWCWNVGLALMVLVSVLPVGFLQLEVAFTESYAAARGVAFYNQPLVQDLF